MSAYVNVQIDADAIFDAMSDDNAFALEVWREMTERLHMGALLDEAMDLVHSGFSKAEKQAMIANFRLMADCVEGQLECEPE
jgi:hypothetical protein